MRTLLLTANAMILKSKPQTIRQQEKCDMSARNVFTCKEAEEGSDTLPRIASKFNEM